MGFCQQCNGLMLKNFRLKRRKPVTCCMEILLPVMAILVMTAIRSAIEVESNDPDLNLDDSYFTPPSEGQPQPFSYSADTDPLDVTSVRSMKELAFKLVKRGHILAISPNVAPFCDDSSDSFSTRIAHIINQTKEEFNLQDMHPEPYPNSCSGSWYLRGFGSSGDMNNYVKSKHYPDDGYLEGGVAFNSFSEDSGLSYNIRFNESDQSSDYDQQVPSSLLPQTNQLGIGTNFDYITTFLFYGFLPLQNFIDSWAIGQISGNDYKAQSTNGFTTQLFPTPEYRTDLFSAIAGSFMPLFFNLAFLYPFFQLSKQLLLEKELRIKEGLKMMGASTASHFMSWFTTYFLLYTMLSVILTMLSFAGGIFKYSDGFIIFLVYWFFLLCVFAMNWLLVTFFSKATSGGLYCAVIFLASFLGIFGFNQETTATSKGFACLSAPMCFGLGIQQIFVFESAQQGVNPSNLSVVQNNFSMSTCIGLLVFDFFLYLALAVYLERVIPSEWGVAEPFYFCFLPSFWGCDGKKGNNEGEDPRNFDHRYEQNANEDAKVGIAIRNLEKRFGNQTAEEAAVKSINLDMYIGQIFSLLGHNGAGKTTTINMLTGMLPPTGGDAIIFGNNIIDQMKTIRKDLGVCPQHDILFENYTVREHLYLFSKIKGIPSGEIENAVRSTIREVGLTEKINTYSQSLSGGMKRKLSVGMALIGGSRAVILDEPTSGMDPYSRRSTWEMLKQAKQGRVLILTTHFMDEADQLGDRIAIMHLGRIKCCGSSLFLKKKYGVGYILTVDKKEGALTNAIQQLVQNSVKECEILSNVAGEISFQLPFSSSHRFPDMFDAIDKNKESWGVNSYSVSVTTLEEVFLKVGNQDDEKLDPELKRRYSSLMSGEDVPDDDDEKSGAAAPPPPIEPHPDDVKKEKLKSMKKPLLNDESLNTSGTSVNFQKLEGFERFKVHFVALMIKRWNFTKRDFWIWIWQIAIPAILLLGMIGLIVGAADLQVKDINIGVGEYNTPNYVPAGPTDYSVDPLSLIDNSQNSVLINATTPVGGDDLVLTEGCSYTNMTPTSSTDMARYLLCTWKEFEQTKYGAFLGPLGDDSSVRDQMNFSTIFTNTTAVFGLPAFLSLRNKARAREALRSKGASSASTFDISLTSSPWPKTAKQKAINQAFTGIAVTIAFAFVPAGVAGFIIRERQTGSKHLQIISGVNIVAYWLSNFAWDFLNFLPSCIIALIVFAIYDLEAYTGDAAGVVFLTSLLFALAIIPFTYCMSFLFKTPATGQVVMLLIYFLSGTILLIVSAILSVISSTKEINDKLKFVYRLVPSYCFGEVVSNLAILSINESSGGNKTNPAKWSTIGWPCVYMTLEAIIYTIILFLIEKILATPDLYARFFPAPAVDDENYEEDQDIVNERKRVQGNKALENWAPDALQVRGLRKVYSGPKVAVKDLWFGIPRGQCFGFLGINGAGKSTTLKMLTGDVLPTLGTANLAGKDILSEQEEVRSLIGYCPQFDALLPNLTARETLRMFATIKGVPPKSLEPYVFEMCKQLSLDMNGWLDKPCGGYSGGNKRKLSVGIALVGNPPIVFLDEPSTGMDPGARRFMWDLISSTMATRSVVLTTHSMEECEALCSRIGIMVGGRLRCIGSSSHLRARYGSGYQLDLKSESGKSFEIRSWVQKEFKGAKIIEDQGQYMKFRLDSTGRTLGSVFRIIESNKQRGIAEYSVSETTLEQIFLHFAKQQEEETGAVAGFVNGSRTHSHSTATVERKASLQETLLEREQKEGYMKL